MTAKTKPAPVTGETITPAPPGQSELPAASKLAVEWWAIARVRKYEKNARQIPPSAISKVAASIKEFGWRQPLVVEPDGVIVAGHVRLLAAYSLKLTEVPVHVAADLSKAQLKALRLADNRTHDEAAWDMQLVGLELADLAQLEYDLKLTGFDKNQAREALLSDWEEEEKETAPSSGYKEQYGVIVICENELMQQEVFDKLTVDGYACKIVCT